MNDKNIESNATLEEKVGILLDRIAILEEDVKNNWDMFLRARADLENVKKRTDREIADITKYANKKLFLDLLPLIDSLEACLNSNLGKEYFESVSLFCKIISNIFEKHGVLKINVEENTVFDPSKHEVVTIVKSDMHNNIIASVLQTGYVLHNHILRYARVSVFKKDI